MEVLTQEQKTFVVQQLAMYRTPTQVVELVKEQFDVTIVRQSVAYYDPLHNKTCPKVWCDLFHTTRKKFLETVSDIPIANQTYRLQQLQDSLNRTLRQPRKNEAMVQNLLEQAAKEVGGMFTNRREVTGKDGKPLLDPVEIAKLVLDDLIKDGIDAPQALQMVMERYKVPQEVLVSEAVN